jgi:hypothetical protein
MNYLLLMLTMLLLVSCKESNNNTATPEPSSIANLELDGFWMYRTADMFMDGGSVVMGFINGNGEVLYVFFDYSIGSSEDPKAYRKCKLQRTYNDKMAVEIPPGSELEGKVISLIEKAHCHEALEKILPSRDKAVEILKTRSIDLRLVGEAKVVPE